MSKKPHLRRPSDKWHGKRTETLLKSERQHVDHIYWFLWRQFSLKKSFWVICKILGLLVNPSTGDDKYSLFNGENFFQDFQMLLSEKRKVCSNFFPHFINWNPIWNFLKKTMTLIAHVFWNVRTRKNVVR